MIPRVSIVIPTFNRPTLLLRAVQSVLAQTFQDFEIIIVDDGDKDRSRATVRTFADPRIRYIENNPPRRGGSATRNAGVNTSQGEYIAFLDDDDEWFPEKLAKEVQVLETAPAGVVFAYCAAMNISEAGEMRTHVPSGMYDLREMVLTRFKGILTSGLIVRRNALVEIGMFDETLPSHQDAELMIRLAWKFQGIGIDEPLVRMNMFPREHINSDVHRRIRGRELVLAKHAELYARYPQKLAKHYFWIGLWCRDAGNRKQAQIFFLKAFRASWNPRYILHFIACLFRVRTVK